MNILMALSQLEVTGAEVYATSIGNVLASRGHKLFYISDTLTKEHQGAFFKLRFNKRSILRRFWHVGYLIYVIKKNKIQMVHAHSRASSWSCHLACKLTNTPMLTTVHGRQPVHASRKKFHAMGDQVLTVCQAIKEQLISDLEVPEAKIIVSHNGIETNLFKPSLNKNNIQDKKNISIIGRLTGPKGDLCYKLLNECIDFNLYNVRIVSGSKIQARFNKFKDKVTFTGYSNDVATLINNSDIIIGAGRVAMEALLCGKPTLAIGEALSIGAITLENLDQAIATNFGDIGPKDLAIDFSKIAAELTKLSKQRSCDPQVTKIVENTYNLNNIVDQIEDIYQSVYSRVKKLEIPVIMYHRFIKDEQGKGVHGTYIDIKRLEQHFKLINAMGFESITFKDLAQIKLENRFNHNKRYIMISVDDGYKDNLDYLLPLLEKYNLKATVFVVTGETYNRWDVENKSNPEVKVPLLNQDEILKLAASKHIEIGGHTLTHPHLPTLTASEQKREILENKQQLEQLLGYPLNVFAYPYGEFNQDSQQIVKELGFNFAVATNGGPLAMHHDLFAIRRIAIFPKTKVLGLWRKIRGNYTYRKNKKLWQ